MIFRMV